MSTTPTQLTPQDFAARIRAKYPGSYDSLSDEDLTSKILAKHPEYQSVVKAPTAPAQQEEKPDTGVSGSLKRTGTGLLHLPAAILDAFSKEPETEDEKSAFAHSGYGGLGLFRLIAQPMNAEKEKAAQYQTQATGSPEVPPLKLGFDASKNIAGDNPQAQSQHLANMHRLASFVPVLGPMAADIAQRYAADDKSGAITDVATAVAGPKVAEGAIGGVGSIVRKVAPELAGKMYQSALKPSTTLSSAMRDSMIKTGLDSRIPVSPAGAEKLSGLIQDLNNKIADQIKAGAKAGQTIDPALVAARTGPLKAKFANQVNPSSDLAAIDEATAEFKHTTGQTPSGQAGPSNQIPVDQAQAMKQGTYQQLKGRAYGELKSAAVESQKALARGIKEELEAQFPEIKGLNAQEAKMIGLDTALDRALNRIGNHQLMGIGTPIVAGAVGGAAGSGPGIVAGVLKALIDDPLVKSKLAISLNRAGRGSIPYGQAAGRVAQYSNALAQSNFATQRAEAEAKANAIPSD